MRAFRPRNQGGFGLVEMLIALTVLAIGVMAIASAFISGTFALRRASQISTATALADRQLERYRALRYSQICLNSASVTAAGPSYLTGFSGALVQSASCTTPAAATTARQDLSGAATPDGNPYRLDTYIVEETPVSDPPIDSRMVKRVTVVIRDGRNLGKVLVRQESTFDESLG